MICNELCNTFYSFNMLFVYIQCEHIYIYSVIKLIWRDPTWPHCNTLLVFIHFDIKLLVLNTSLKF